MRDDNFRYKDTAAGENLQVKSVKERECRVKTGASVPGRGGDGGGAVGYMVSDPEPVTCIMDVLDPDPRICFQCLPKP